MGSQRFKMPSSYASISHAAVTIASSFFLLSYYSPFSPLDFFELLDVCLSVCLLYVAR